MNSRRFLHVLAMATMVPGCWACPFRRGQLKAEKELAHVQEELRKERQLNSGPQGSAPEGRIGSKNALQVTSPSGGK